MKLTQQQLKQIIKEEVQKALNERITPTPETPESKKKNAEALRKAVESGRCRSGETLAKCRLRQAAESVRADEKVRDAAARRAACAGLSGGAAKKCAARWRAACAGLSGGAAKKCAARAAAKSGSKKRAKWWREIGSKRKFAEDIAPLLINKGYRQLNALPNLLRVGEELQSDRGTNKLTLTSKTNKLVGTIILFFDINWRCCTEGKGTWTVEAHERKNFVGQKATGGGSAPYGTVLYILWKPGKEYSDEEHLL